MRWRVERARTNGVSEVSKIEEILLLRRQCGRRARAIETRQRRQRFNKKFIVVFVWSLYYCQCRRSYLPSKWITSTTRRHTHHCHCSRIDVCVCVCPHPTLCWSRISASTAFNLLHIRCCRRHDARLSLLCVRLLMTRPRCARLNLFTHTHPPAPTLHDPDNVPAQDQRSRHAPATTALDVPQRLRRSSASGGPCTAFTISQLQYYYYYYYYCTRCVAAQRSRRRALH